MSHCNITMRDRFSTVEQLRENLAITQLKLTRAEQLLEEAERSLSSIFDRIKSGEEVYLCYPDGSHIYIKAVPPKAKAA